MVLPEKLEMVARVISELEHAGELAKVMSASSNVSHANTETSIGAIFCVLEAKSSSNNALIGVAKLSKYMSDKS